MPPLVPRNFFAYNQDPTRIGLVFFIALARYPSAAFAPEILVPGAVRMVLADPSHSETNLAFAVHRLSSASCRRGPTGSTTEVQTMGPRRLVS